MLKHLSLDQLRHALHLLACRHDEGLRAYPERIHTLDLAAQVPEDLAEANRNLQGYLEELGYEAVLELVALMYLGRDGERDLPEWREYLRGMSRGLDAVASSLHKSPVLEYIAIGLARVGGVT